MKTSVSVEQIESDVMAAYTDCWSAQPFEITQNLRNLDFRADGPVSREDAVRIMSRAVPNGYNEFDADLLARLPDGCAVTLAREGSVCVYVDKRPTEEMNCDELDTRNGETRIWWD